MPAASFGPTYNSTVWTCIMNNFPLDDTGSAVGYQPPAITDLGTLADMTNMSVPGLTPGGGTSGDAGSL